MLQKPNYSALNVQTVQSETISFKAAGYLGNLWLHQYFSNCTALVIDNLYWNVVKMLCKFSVYVPIE